MTRCMLMLMATIAMVAMASSGEPMAQGKREILGEVSLDPRGEWH